MLLAACTPQGTATTLQGTAGTPPATLRVVIDNNYPPYTFLDEEGQLQGILIDEWALWSQKTGIPVQVTGLDWGEALERMQAGEFDVIDTIFLTERRKQVYDFTAPYASIAVPIFSHKNIGGIVDARSLSGFRVAVKAGDAAIDYLKEQGITNLWEFPSYEAIVEAAREGEVVVFVIDQPPGQYFLYRAGLQNDFNLSAPLYAGQFHRAVLKGNAATLRLVEEGFARISAEEFKAIEQRWFGVAASASMDWGWLLLVAGVGGIAVLALVSWNWGLQRVVAQRTGELSQVKTNLAEGEERMRLIFDLVNDAVFALDLPFGRIVDANQRACELFGGRREELCTFMFAQLSAGYSPYGQKEAQAWMEKAQAGTPQVFEWLARRTDGSLFWVEINMSKGSLGGKPHIILAARDVSERKQAQQALVKSNMQLSLAYDATLEGWSAALELRERDTAGHSERVVGLAMELAEQFNIGGEDLVHFRRGAILHDIGKMGVPDNVLLKPGPLSPDEWVLMRQHPLYAYHLLSGIDYLRPCLDIPYCHHERWDGSGYPRGLKGREIPLAARIFAVVDVWDALTSDRPYRPAWTRSAAQEYLRQQAAVQFDPQVVERFLQIIGG